jgi:hypothetical protein
VGLLRKHPLGEPRDEHHAERPAARLLRASDEYPSVPIARRLGLERQEPIRDDLPRFVEPDRADLAHRTELRDHVQHTLGLLQHHRGNGRKAIEPFTPGRGARPRREQVHNRQREGPEVAQVA